MKQLQWFWSQQGPLTCSHACPPIPRSHAASHRLGFPRRLSLESIPHWTLTAHWCQASRAQVQSTARWNGGEGGQKLLQFSKPAQSQGFWHSHRNLWRPHSRILFPPHYWYQQPSPGTPDFQAPLCIPSISTAHTGPICLSPLLPTLTGA